MLNKSDATFLTIYDWPRSSYGFRLFKLIVYICLCDAVASSSGEVQDSLKNEVCFPNVLQSPFNNCLELQYESLLVQTFEQFAN